MRILIFPMGSAGDVHPFIGVGKALQARGHDVYIITSGYFEGLVTRAGLGFRPIGSAEDFEAVQADPDIWHPTRAFGALVRLGLNRSYGPIVEHARELHKPGDTVLVAGTLAIGARNARDLLDAPLVTAHLAPCLFLSAYRLPRMHGAPVPQWGPRWLKRLMWYVGSRVADKHVLPVLNAFRREHGLQPARDIIRNWWHSPDRVIGLFPEWFGPPQPDWPTQVRVTGFPMFDEAGMTAASPELEQFLAAGEPPVVLTPGTSMAHGREFFAAGVEALKLSGLRGILLTKFADTIPTTLPPGVRHFSYVPFSEVLPRSAALVYHGGVGTCAQALRAGIPHLVYHMAHDQLDNLSRVRDLGVGDGLAPKQFKPQRIAAMLKRLLEDGGVKSRARALSQRFDTEAWICETCELIESTRKESR